MGHLYIKEHDKVSRLFRFVSAVILLYEQHNSQLPLMHLEEEVSVFFSPSKEFELTAKTLQAHMKTHSKLILKPLIYYTANSQDDLTL